MTVTCSTKDTFPAEASELVRTYAYVALERCLRKCMEAEPEVPPEPPPAAKKAMYESLAPLGTTPDYNDAVLLTAYYSPEKSEPPATVFSAARLTLARGLDLSPQTVARLSGPRTVRDVVFPEVRPVSLSLPQFTLPKLPFGQRTPAAIPVREEPRHYVMNVTGPVEPGRPIVVSHSTPVQEQPQPERKPGRGNLLHIAQDAWRK
jgi:hypothetical protein